LSKFAKHKPGFGWVSFFLDVNEIIYVGRPKVKITSLPET
jgi:hypothetical protein